MEEGDRVELVHTSDPYTNLAPGDRGTLKGTRTEPDLSGSGEVTKWQVEWDSGSTLSMIQGEDRIRKLDEDELREESTTRSTRKP